MLTEIDSTKWAVRVNGQVVQTNLPSRMLAEHIVLQLPPEQRSLAEIYPISSDGRSVLLG